MEFYTINQRSNSPAMHISTPGYPKEFFTCILLNSKQEDTSNITPEIFMAQGKTDNKNLYNGKLYNINIKNVPRHKPEYIISTGAVKRRKTPLHKYFIINASKTTFTTAFINKPLPDLTREKSTS